MLHGCCTAKSNAMSRSSRETVKAARQHNCKSHPTRTTTTRRAYSAHQRLYMYDCTRCACKARPCLSIPSKHELKSREPSRSKATIDAAAVHHAWPRPWIFVDLLSTSSRLLFQATGVDDIFQLLFLPSCIPRRAKRCAAFSSRPRHSNTIRIGSSETISRRKIIKGSNFFPALVDGSLPLI